MRHIICRETSYGICRETSYANTQKGARPWTVVREGCDDWPTAQGQELRHSSARQTSGTL